MNNKEIAFQISKFRKQKDLKANFMAEKLNMSESNYTRYENGQLPITVDLIGKIAQVLEIGELELLGKDSKIEVLNSPNSQVAQNSNAHNNHVNENLMNALLKTISLLEDSLSMLKNEKKNKK